MPVNDVVDLDNKDSKDKSISAKTISLLVTPAQAAKVTLASEMGKLRLVMRGPEDTAHVDDASSKPEELFGRASSSDRKKEEQVAKPSEDKKGFLDILSQMKTQIAVQPVVEHKQTSSWTMRILNPDGVNDVVMESENATGTDAAASEHWRISSSAPTSFGTGNSAGETKRLGEKRKGRKSISHPCRPTGYHGSRRSDAC